MHELTEAAGDLHWLESLLTGRRELAFDLSVQAVRQSRDSGSPFSTWMRAWSRKIVISRALAAIREDLAVSARRTAMRRDEGSGLPPRFWVLGRNSTKWDLERALLAMDVFPRAVVLLLVFEKMPLNDAVILLDSNPDLVRTGLAIGVRDLTTKLAGMQGSWKSIGTSVASVCTNNENTS